MTELDGTMPAKFRKKPVVIEAMELTRDDVFAIEKWCSGRVVYTPTGKIAGIDIPTLEGKTHASMGDYVIKGVQGEFYACKPDIFEMTYEPST